MVNFGLYKNLHFIILLWLIEYCIVSFFNYIFLSIVGSLLRRRILIRILMFVINLEFINIQYLIQYNITYYLINNILFEETI